ncbi:class I SAM-dependent methyltransferase [Bellilinea sp.]
MSSNHFDYYYYQHDCGIPYERNEQWLNFFGKIAERIKQDINPKTVLDAGCAMGFLVEKLRQNDIEAYGLDVSSYAISKVHESIQPYCWVGSVSEELSRDYDLIVCIEVLEHVPKPEAISAIENFCRHTQMILFSSSPFDYSEATHVNVNPIDYWSELFARHGFIRDLDFDASFITPWAVLYRKTNLAFHYIVKNYEKKLFLLSQEIRAQREQLLSYKEKVSDLSSQVSNLLKHLENLEVAIRDRDLAYNNIIKSTSWKILMSLGRLRLKIFPDNSLRWRLLRKIIGKE